jgi:hypothetical protein
MMVVTRAAAAALRRPAACIHICRCWLKFICLSANLQECVWLCSGLLLVKYLASLPIAAVANTTPAAELREA